MAISAHWISHWIDTVCVSAFGSILYFILFLFIFLGLGWLQSIYETGTHSARTIARRDFSVFMVFTVCLMFNAHRQRRPSITRCVAHSQVRKAAGDFPEPRRASGTQRPARNFPSAFIFLLASNFLPTLTTAIDVSPWHHPKDEQWKITVARCPPITWQVLII